ncbi:MAG: reductive dehalogenase domain-containing protein [Candidatus Eisenbacteria bacterium]
MPTNLVTQPHYERDRVGRIERVDERDVLFARADLFRQFPDGSPERDRYYSAHPEAREYDQRIADELRLGSTGGDYAALCAGVFHSPRVVARDEFVDGEPAPEKVALSPEEATRRVKALARTLGADLVGTGPLRPEWVYSRVGRSFGNAEGFPRRGSPIDLSHHTDAVSMGFRMEPDFVAAAPEFPTVLATGVAYAIGARAAVRLAQYIRSLGYSARAHHVYSYGVLPVPVAVDCGLGELSRAGFLLTKEYGLGVRLGTVTTDLPLAHDGPAGIGVQSFCERCEICAEYCPSQSIPRGAKTECNGVLKWKLDAESCYRYWTAVSTDCSICMSTCPWTKTSTWFHRALTFAATFKGPHQLLMVAAERLFYGRPDKRRRGRTRGMESLRPTRLRLHMRLLAAAMVALAGLGLLWGSAGLPLAAATLSPAGWIAYLVWLAWTLTGSAAVWTFLAERTVRPALVALAFFGILFVVIGATLVW